MAASWDSGPEIEPGEVLILGTFVSIKMLSGNLLSPKG